MSSISIALAAARQAAAIGPNAQKPPAQPQASGYATAQPVTPAKPPGTGLLVDTRV